jgi:tetratricopeptide (TPR) repeat protein
MGEALYLLAEEYRATGETKSAGEVYRECTKYETRFAYLAHYQLAMAALKAGEVDTAREILAFNLSRMRWGESDPDALAQSLFAYCNLLYNKRAFPEVVRRLEEALDRYRDKFKDVGELTRARYQLADSYRQIAAEENKRLLLNGRNYSKETLAHFEKEHRRWLLKAAEEFAALDTFLDGPEGQGHLTADQRTQVPFITAKCWFNLGKYKTALKIYERLIDRHKGKVEGLDALGGAVSCHAALAEINHVRQRLNQVDQALAAPDLPEEVRAAWKAWLDEAKEGLKGI